MGHSVCWLMEVQRQGGEVITVQTLKLDAPWVEFMDFVFTHMSGESYCRHSSNCCVCVTSCE